jgi:hypothetical protein
MAQAHANKDARRSAVAAAVQPNGTLSYAQRRALAQQFGCAPVTIYDDMRRVQTPPMPAVQGAPAVLRLTAPGALVADRDIAILRLLGRLEFVTTAMLKALIAPDLSLPALRERLNRLLKEGRSWRQTVTIEQVQPREAGGRSQPPPKAPYVYGLTPEGRELLELLDVESSAAVYAALQTRDRRAPNVPQAQLKHDLLVSSWCASVIDGARRSRLLDTISCQVEYVSARTPDGKEQQRMDALLALIFNREPQQQTAPLWMLPWNQGEPPTPRQRVARYAAEIDRGTEPLKTLLAKGLTYRTLTESGHYRQTLGGAVLPVILVPPGKRAAQIAREWQTSWPGGPGVISNFLKADHPTHGALWGAYYTLTDSPPQLTHLLTGIFPDLATWEQWAR